MEGHYSSGRHMESAQSKDDLANQSLDVVAQVLFQEPPAWSKTIAFEHNL